MTDIDRTILEREARSNLAAFILSMHDDYLMGWFHRELCSVLMRFYLDVRAGKRPRLILNAPPRHGKSQAISRDYPPWLFGVNPDVSIIAASYGQDLANSMSRDVQAIMKQEEYRRIFPKVNLLERKSKKTNVTATQTAKYFEIPGRKGKYIAAGVGSGITGKGALIAIIDDPFKDREEADSPTIREKVYNWYTSTFRTRLAPGGGIIVMHTRWHEDDLVGRLLQKAADDSGEKFELINYPAIAEEDEPHRKKGEPLHPERYDMQELEAIRKAVGSRDWSALYQGRPVPATGGVFKGSWIRHWDVMPTIFERVIQSWDFTFKDAENSDYVAGQVWGKVGANFYLLDAVCERMDFVSQVRAMRRMSAKWPQAIEKVVEDKANGPAIIAMLGSEIPGIVPYTPRGSKTARAYAVSPLFESGNVLIPPADERYPWVRHYMEEILSFPNAPHDDQVDATTQALDTLAVNYGGGIIDFL